MSMPLMLWNIVRFASSDLASEYDQGRMHPDDRVFDSSPGVHSWSKIPLVTYKAKVPYSTLEFTRRLATR